MATVAKIEVEHLRYLRDDFGLKGLMTRFPQSRSVSFLRWLSGEIRRNDGSDDATIAIPEVHAAVAHFCFSFLSFKLVTESVGRADNSSVAEVLSLLSAEDQGGANDEEREAVDLDAFRENVVDSLRDSFDSVVKFGNEFAHAEGFADISVSPSLRYHFRANTESEHTKDEVVTLALHSLVADHALGSMYSFNESGAFVDSDEIGPFISSDWKVVVTSLICREVARVVQYAIWREAVRNRDAAAQELYGRVSGVGFRTIYRALRSEFVNANLAESQTTPTSKAQVQSSSGGGSSGGMKVEMGAPPSPFPNVTK